MLSVHDYAIQLSVYVVPPPPLGPDESTAPSFFAFDQQFSIGALPAGTYTLDVSVVDSDTIGSGSTLFSVIPEPAAGPLLVLGLVGMRACRPTRRCTCRPRASRSHSSSFQVS